MSCFRVTWYWTSHNLFSCLLCCFFSFLFCWLVDIILFHCPVSVFASVIDPKLANTLVRLVKILCLWYNWARQKILGGYLRICMLWLVLFVNCTTSISKLIRLTIYSYNFLSEIHAVFQMCRKVNQIAPLNLRHVKRVRKSCLDGRFPCLIFSFVSLFFLLFVLSKQNAVCNKKLIEDMQWRILNFINDTREFRLSI